MNVDAPEDRVHTLLAEALFPDHPLGREVLGDRTRSRRSAATTDRRVLPTSWYRPANVVVVAAGHSTTTRSSLRSDRGARSTATVASCPTAERADRTARAASSVERDDTEQAHLGLGLARRSPTTTTTATPSRSPTRCSAAGRPAGCSRRSARSGAWPTRCTRTRPPTPTPVRSRSTPAPRRAGSRDARCHRRRARRPRRRTVPPSASWPSPRATSRARWCSASRTRGRMGRLGPQPRPARRGHVRSTSTWPGYGAVSVDDVRPRRSSGCSAGPRSLAAVGPFDDAVMR